MKVKFSKCTSNNLSSVPKVDGQLIYVVDTGECYLDDGSNRISIGINEIKAKELIDTQVDEVLGDINNILDEINGEII